MTNPVSDRAMLQPHEGIQGTDRTDDLLSLDEAAVLHREVIRTVTNHLWSACLVGDPAPKVKRMYERMSKPEIGDLVVETSTLYRADADSRLRSFGFLVEHREEWACTDEEWDARVAEERQWHIEHGWEWDEEGFRSERMPDHAWYVQYGPDAGDICRWTNCSFMVVPLESSFSMDVGTRDGNAVTLTRDDLLSSFADSGFTLRPPGGVSHDT